MNNKEGGKKLSLTPKTAHDIAFKVHKRHYYDCREVDDVLDALLELIDRQEEDKQCIEQRLREYEAHIAGILLDCQKFKADAGIPDSVDVQASEDSDESCDVAITDNDSAD